MSSWQGGGGQCRLHLGTLTDEALERVPVENGPNRGNQLFGPFFFHYSYLHTDVNVLLYSCRRQNDNFPDIRLKKLGHHFTEKSKRRLTSYRHMNDRSSSRVGFMWRWPRLYRADFGLLPCHPHHTFCNRLAYKLLSLEVVHILTYDS